MPIKRSESKEALVLLDRSLELAERELAEFRKQVHAECLKIQQSASMRHGKGFVQNMPSIILRIESVTNSLRVQHEIFNTSRRASDVTAMPTNPDRQTIKFAKSKPRWKGNKEKKAQGKDLEGFSHTLPDRDCNRKKGHEPLFKPTGKTLISPTTLMGIVKAIDEHQKWEAKKAKEKVK